MKLLGKTSQYDKIMTYMRDPDGDVSLLSAHDQLTLDRWMEAFTLGKNNTLADTTAILMKRFPGISRATAYRDCANAVSLFGDMSKSTKDGIRHLAMEWVKEAKIIATQQRDAAEIKNCGLAIAKIAGVNQTDPDVPNFELLEPHTYEFGLPPAFVAMFKGMINGGAVDLSEMVNNMGNKAEDAIILDTEDDE